MKTILVPTDFSEEAGNATSLAAAIAKKSGAKLILLNVIEHVGDQSFNEMGEANHDVSPENQIYILQLMKLAKGKMHELKDQLEGLDVLDEVKVGHPFSHISNTITEENVDMVVMGSTGSSGLREILVGSNAEKVVRHAKCPVLTVKGKVEVDKISEVFFATDLSKGQENVLKKLKNFTDLLGVHLKLVKINTPSDWQTDREVQEKLKSLTDAAGVGDFDFQIYNADYVEDGIIQYADDYKADMIAMATHGRTGIAHVVAGSVAEDIVNHALRPIWTMNINA